MPKRVIKALRRNAAEPAVYFVGYRDMGAESVCRWTNNPAHALWLDADEAEVEASLLASQCVDSKLITEPLGG